MLIKKYGLRVATGYVYDSDATIRLLTDVQLCEGVPNVGDSIVLTDQVEFGKDYHNWYRVVLEDLKDNEATLELSIGTGKAPVGTESSCGTYVDP